MESTPAARSRLIEWPDPKVALAVLRRPTGWNTCRAWSPAGLPPPPIARLMNTRLVEVERGRAVFEIASTNTTTTRSGSCTAASPPWSSIPRWAAPCTPCLESDDRYTTLEIKVNYLKAMTTATGLVRGIGRSCISAARRRCRKGV